jgi:hypothetical protein
VFWKELASPDAFLHWLAGALCRGGTSESVRMLREMVVEEVGHFGGCYILAISCRGWD